MKLMDNANSSACVPARASTCRTKVNAYRWSDGWFQECLDAAHQAAIAATHHAVEAAKLKAQIIFASSSRCLASTPVVQSFDLEIALHWPPARHVWRGRDRSPSAPCRRSSIAPRRSLRRPQRAASRLCRGYRGYWPARFDAFGVLAVGCGLGFEGPHVPPPRRQERRAINGAPIHIQSGRRFRAMRAEPRALGR